MQEDERCCGSGTCIIDADGLCWCGQRWDGDRLCEPDRQTSLEPDGVQPKGQDADT